jgi:hypothetical protein
VLKEHFGQLPLVALEEPDEINRFKTDSEYAEDVIEPSGAGTVAGRDQLGLRTITAVVHQVAVPSFRRPIGQEGRNDARPACVLGGGAAIALHSAERDDTPEHQFVGTLLHDPIVGALELCCRRDEMLFSEPPRRPNLRLICLESAAV